MRSAATCIALTFAGALTRPATVRTRWAQQGDERGTDARRILVTPPNKGD